MLVYAYDRTGGAHYYTIHYSMPSELVDTRQQEL